MDEIYKLLDAYAEKFGDAFPTMEYMLEPNELKRILRRCIQNDIRIQDLVPQNENEKDIQY